MDFLKVNTKEEVNNKALNYLYKEKKNNNSLISIKKLKKIVYSVILGEYDKIHPFDLQEGFDFILFTDIENINYNKTNWTILPLPNELKHRNISRVKKQRFIKLHPHLYFKNYNLSIYIDASLQIKGDLNEFLLRILSTKYKIKNIFEYFITIKTASKKNQNIFVVLINFYKEINS